MGPKKTNKATRKVSRDLSPTERATANVKGGADNTQDLREVGATVQQNMKPKEAIRKP